MSGYNSYQCLSVRTDILISTHYLSPCWVRSWDLRSGRCVASLSLHRDYILCMAARDHPASGEGVLVTGGAADHAVIVYDIDTAGAIACRHQMSGHRCGDTSKYL